MKFADLKLNEKTLTALASLHYDVPTEVQATAIPDMMAGRNLLVRSQTGTGKTAAFGIGIIERIAAGTSKAALVLTPTRELAVQVCTEIQSIGANHKMRIHVVYGGQSIERQVDELRGGVDILIATPGRLLDLCRRGVVRIGIFDIIVLDEADMMLDMGFIDEVSEILDQLPPQRLSILLSATLDQNILQMASKYVKNSRTIEIGDKAVVATVTEEYVEATDREKFSHLMEVLRTHTGMKILIFRETKRGVERLQENLWQRNFKAGQLQGDMSQAKRNSVLTAFKAGALDILVATNVAARGLHIDNLGLVVNYDRAQTEEVHLHRVGRTGRMSTEGKAITFIQKKESMGERMSHEHPDFAWMRGGTSAIYIGRDRGPNRGERGGGYGGRSGGYGGRPERGRPPHSGQGRPSEGGGYGRASQGSEHGRPHESRAPHAHSTSPHAHSTAPHGTSPHAPGTAPHTHPTHRGPHRAPAQGPNPHRTEEEGPERPVRYGHGYSGRSHHEALQEHENREKSGESGEHRPPRRRPRHY